jgi:hypothetical protein
MEAAVADSQLSADKAQRFRFALARREDDASIRRLLRENPMQGEISLSFEREPNYFKGMSMPGTEDQTILALEGDEIVCMGRCSIRERFVNGSVRRVGYLSELRLARRLQGRSDIIRRGYQFFEKLDRAAEYYFTSIASDNFRSTRLLERGLPGLPAYTPLGEFVTLVIPIPRQTTAANRIFQCASQRLERHGLRHITAANNQFDEVTDFLNHSAERHQLAARWSQGELRKLVEFGIEPSDIHVVLDGRVIVACATVWDQRPFRQTLIRGYSPRLAFVRPWLNAGARIFGFPRLPEPGSELAHAYLSPLAINSQSPDILVDLVRLCAAGVASKGIEYLTLGFGAQNPQFEAVGRAFSCRRYSSQLYQVHWPKQACRPEPLKGRMLFPEIAFL